MLSVILYGRNDNYGYNLHKRAALSLNCMAEVLTDVNDEIIFVDYNTPDDYPTFPEAIADTLTPKARSLLRVIRVRPEVHRARFEPRTHLKAIEPVSRNVAIRRANPDNRWILSTNTDIIFVPRAEASLTDAIAGFADGFYCAPRIEIPETLWESYDRLDPAGVIAETRHWGSAMHLDEIVFGSQTILYDGPGDFQLMLRKDLFEIHGFHEGMLLGWHVDSNIFKRLGFVYESIGDAAPAVFGYHCDHTRQVTPAHAHRSPENDSAEFVDRVTAPGIPEQCKNWGLADLLLEEVRLDRSVNQDYRRALSRAISEPLARPIEARYQSITFDQTWAEPEHVLPFLLDLFSNAPRSDSVLWLGQGGRLLDLFRQCWNELGFTGKVIADPTIGEEDGSFPGMSAFVINFGVPNVVVEKERALAAEQFLAVAQGEARHQKLGGSPRRIVGVNTVNSRLDFLMLNNVGCAKTPFSTRLRHGFLLLDMVSKQSQNWTSEMSVGSIGVRRGHTIATTTNEAGPLAYGPYRTLWPGDYLAMIRIIIDPPSDLNFGDEECRIVTVQLVLSEVVQQTFHLTADTVGDCIYNFPFTISYNDVLKTIQIRFLCHGVTPVVLHSIEVQSAYGGLPPDGNSIRLLPETASQRQNWTKRMSVGRAGVRKGNAIASKPNEVGDFAFGPYLTLSPGKYRACVRVTIVRPSHPNFGDKECRAMTIELVLSEVVKQTFHLTLDTVGDRMYSFPFEIANEDVSRTIQIRFSCYGVTPVVLHSIEVQPAVSQPSNGNSIRLFPGAASHRLLPEAASPRQNWTKHMSVGHAGVRKGDAIASKPNEVGDFAFGPYPTLFPGKYRAFVRVTIVRPRRLFIWRWRQRRRRVLSIELVLDEVVRQALDLTLDNVGKRTFKFPFIITNKDAARQIQIRLKCYAVTPIVLHSVNVERIDGVAQWLKAGLPIRFRPSQMAEKVVERELQ